MIRHLFTLAWNRKGANALVMIEILVSFLVLFAVTVMAVFFATNYMQPLGFSYENVLNVEIDVKQESDDSWTPEQIETTRQVLLAIESFDEVEAAAGSLSIPYSFSGSTSQREINGRRIEFDRGEVTDDLAEVLGFRITSGRWFSKEDDGAPYTPIVINERLARELFGDQDPIGKMYATEDASRVVGVIEEYRRKGELIRGGNVMFERRTLEDGNRPPRNVLVRVRPGTTAEFEERLAEKLQAVARDWSFQIEPLAEIRHSMLQGLLAPLLMLALVAGFLLLMVGLGLVGVLWQNVTRRRPEIGVRRAQGATAADIRALIVGEVSVLTTISLLVGSGVVVQLPLLDLTFGLSAGIFFGGLAVSIALMYLLTTVCALYPSWLATRIQPAEALHYE